MCVEFFYTEIQGQRTIQHTYMSASRRVLHLCVIYTCQHEQEIDWCFVGTVMALLGLSVRQQPKTTRYV